MKNSKLKTRLRFAAFIILHLAICIFNCRATQVYFPILDMTGATNDVTVNVRAVNNPVIYNGAFYYLPANGTNFSSSGGYATNSFVPGRYTASIAGVPRSWKLNITNSATAVNATHLATELVIYTGVETIIGNGIQVTNDGAGNFSVVQTNSGTVQTNINYTAVTNLDSRLSTFAATNAEIFLPALSPELPQSVAAASVTTPGEFFHQNSSFTFVGGTQTVVGAFCVPDVAGISNLLGSVRRLHLRIYPDIGTNTNSPPASFQAVSVPLGLLLGNFHRYTTNGEYAITRSTAFLDTVVCSTNSVGGWQIPTASFDLKFKFQVTNGCLFQIWDTVSDAAWTNGYFNIQHHPGVSALPQWGNHRLRSTNYHGHLVGATTNTIATVSGSGYVVGVLASVLNTTNSQGIAFCDSKSLRFETGGSASVQVASGFDDFFGATYGYRQGLTLGWEKGVMNFWHDENSIDGAFGLDAYRWFTYDTIRFTNNLTVKFAPAATTDEMDITIFTISTP